MTDQSSPLRTEPTTADDTAYWVALSQVPGLGPVKFNRLLTYFGSTVAAWEAPPRQLLDAGLDTRTVRALEERRLRQAPDRDLQTIVGRGVIVLTLADERYPRLLREITAPPPVLYVKGSLEASDEQAIAVVGTRTCTPYGKMVTEQLVRALVGAGYVIVSGLARGVDSHAHRTALTEHGRTMAVLGSGVNVIYPSEHRQLAEQVSRSGALISEYPPFAKPERDNFPARNRIIAGVSLGALVVEAGEVSGALITARMALEQNREVFAVPGSITSPASDGTNGLIKRGEAKLVSRVEDILEELEPATAQRVVQHALTEVLPENELEATLLRLLAAEALHVDELSRSAELPVATVSGTLTVLELKGLVHHLGGMVYCRSR
ncbi:MAG: DNA-processing protein DprA [Chloroflexi bacterium]|nr:DNA-processing protein DprA [Chloroflexota bacterium]